MNICLTDVGSNTVRTVVYNEKREHLFNKAVRSTLFDNTENGKLTAAGIETLAADINALHTEAAVFEPQYFAFATSAFRDLKNAVSAANEIKRLCGMDLRVLSGDEEAECDYIALRSEAENGIGLDLGGGSCQLLRFNETGLEASVSLDIGTARMKRQFAADTPPSGEQEIAICRYVTEKIENSGFSGKSKALYVMGGTVRGLQSVKRALSGEDGDVRIFTDELAEYTALAREGMSELFARILKERYDTALVGAAILSAAAKLFEAKEIVAVKNGVREGFLKKYVSTVRPQS